jgi:hypothetical protein
MIIRIIVNIYINYKYSAYKLLFDQCFHFLIEKIILCKLIIRHDIFVYTIHV